MSHLLHISAHRTTDGTLLSHTALYAGTSIATNSVIGMVRRSLVYRGFMLTGL